jgi:hypothetical protein
MCICVFRLQTLAGKAQKAAKDGSEKKVIDPKRASAPMHANGAYFLYVYLRILFAGFVYQGSECC